MRSVTAAAAGSRSSCHCLRVTNDLQHLRLQRNPLQRSFASLGQIPSWQTNNPASIERVSGNLYKVPSNGAYGIPYKTTKLHIGISTQDREWRANTTVQ